MDVIKVLLLENNPDDIALLRRALISRNNENFEVTVKENSAVGLNVLAQGQRYDVVLLGANQPEDIDPLETIRDLAPRAAIIVLTTRAYEHLALQTLRSGADDYLAKSEVLVSVLSRVIRYAVERRRAQTQVQRAQQLEMLNQITAAAMHEFNNLVLIMSGNLDLLPVPAESPEFSMRMEKIKGALHRMTALIGDLSKFTRSQSSSQLPQVGLDAALANVEKIMNRNMLDSSIHV
ncbi:MAG TPA: response regulator [Candidatus Angelobacter sp.]|nr:response regulator [Candidatus Angelobacter sp.]